jgi:AAA domain/Bifunctional DNA primase/polymerase, N-terminal
MVRGPASSLLLDRVHDLGGRAARHNEGPGAVADAAVAAAMTRTAMLDAALEYAARGVPVFPVWGVLGGHCECGHHPCGDTNRTAGKHPLAALVPNGVLSATADPAMVRAWWTRYAMANIGTATCWATVLDVDPRHGGDAALDDLELRHGPLPDTAEVLTGGGGRHVYFRPEPELTPSSGRVGSGLDIKTGPGAYVLLPPSSHVSGGIYCDELMRPLFDTPLAPMPLWLVTLAATASTANGSAASAPYRSPDEWAHLLTGAPEGQRRDAALKIAGHYLGQGIAEAEVATILLGYAGRCVPPFPEREARALVRDLARRQRAQTRTPVAEASTPVAEGGLGLVALGDLLAEPDEAHTWVVDQRLPSAGLGLLAGKPKAGKSTAARCLALAVARGKPWLGFATTQGPVVYLALEEKRAEVRQHFRGLGATAEDPIFILCSSAPLDALARLRREAEQRRPVLIIIDPLFRLVRVDDGNDYATMTAALEPLMVLARETGAHVLLVHHLGKGERAGADAILGSTAILGAVDTALLMRRGDRYRTLESIQRYGEDLEEISVELDPVTRNVHAGGTRAEAELADAARLILECLAGVYGPVTEAELDGAIECRRQLWKRALRDLVGTGTVLRTGRGGKTDPFRYCGSPSISGNQGTRTLFPDLTADPESKDSGSHQVPEGQVKDSGSLVPHGIEVPVVPTAQMTLVSEP